MPRFDPQAHRALKNYSRAVLARRVCWAVGKTLLRVVPRFCYSLRNSVLRAFGARIGKRVRIYPSADIFYPWNLELGDDVTLGWDVRIYSLGRISIGAASMISQGAHLCAGTHNLDDKDRPLITPPIRVGVGVWIAADAFIGPGVTIGDDAVVGARSVVVKDVPQSTVVAGNPARTLRILEHE